jgi:hypothetical protein
MGNADRYKREQDLIFQELEAMEKREQVQLHKMEQQERDRFLIRFWRGNAVWELLTSVPPAAQKEITDACLKAWKLNQESIQDRSSIQNGEDV